MSQKNTVDSRAQSEHFHGKIISLKLGEAVPGQHSVKRIHQVSVRYVRKQGHLGGLVE